MELKEFITRTLIDIKEGIQEADNKGVNIHYGNLRTVDFDVSVTTSSMEGTKVGAGIFISAIKMGGDKTDQNNNSAVTRIKFDVKMYQDAKGSDHSFN